MTDWVLIRWSAHSFVADCLFLFSSDFVAMLYVNSQIPAIECLARLGFSLSVGQEPTLPTVGLLNLMPQKPETEFDFCKMLSAANLDVNLVLLKIPHQHYKTTPQTYVDAHYVDFVPSMAEASEGALVCGCGEKQLPSIDGLIVTGAPLEQMPFEEVRYWKELQDLWDWTAHCGIPTLNICWAAQAALHHLYGWDKRALSEKCFGIFAQRNLVPQHPLLRGLGERFPMPHSRHTEVCWGVAGVELALSGCDWQGLPEGLEVLADSEVGQSILYDAARQQTFVTGHLEYRADTLDGEYRRDLAKGVPIAPPLHYYIEDNPENGIDFSWEETALLFYRNWLMTHLGDSMC